MEIRPLVVSDLPGVAGLYLETFNAPPWNDGWSESAALERLRRYHDMADSVGVVAIEGAKVVGFALGMAERWVGGEHFHLKEMCTSPDRQRTGIGSLVLEELMRILRDRGVEAIYLETRPQSGAAEFYAKNGFRVLNLQSMTRGIDAV